MLSVIIPVYNVEKYLTECLTSVVNQTFKDIEIIIINDGSSDNSQGIINKFISKDKRIVCIKQVNQGISSARNAGLKIARGDYITFLDSDDCINENMYEKMIYNIEKEAADVVACGVYDFYKDKSVPSLELKAEVIRNINNNKDEFFMFHVLKEGNVVWNKIYKNKIIKDNEILFTDRKNVLQEDFLFNFKYYLAVDTAVNMSELLVYYRIRKSSISKAKNNKLGEMNLRLIDYMDNYKKKTIYRNQLDSFISKKAYSLLNISTYSTDNDSIHSIKNVIIKFTKNKYYIKAHPVKLKSLSLKRILEYIIDSLIFNRLYSLAAFIQWTRMKIYKRKRIKIIDNYYE